MERTCIVDVLKSTQALESVTICGWIRTRRDAKGFCFLEINDGSSRTGLQCIVDEGTESYSNLGSANNGAALSITGSLVASPGKGQKWEIHAKSLTVFGLANQDEYPLQKKRHSDEYLRTIAHLRPRTNKYAAMLRVRSEAAFALHTFFRKEHFTYVNTPLLTGSDCEGAGEMFRVTALAANQDQNAPDFFDRPCKLTVSGQLEGEALALALGRIYTFGPTFRAENSNTPRHAAEFWMVEPEMAFADLEDDCKLATDCLKFVINHILTNCEDDIALFANFVDKTLTQRLSLWLKNDFTILPYRECIQILTKSSEKFVYPVAFGIDLQTEHERYLAEKHCKGPVIITDYPKSIKPFYMRENDDGQTVAAMDVLVPGIGEIIGGSQREERLDRLKKRMEECKITSKDYWWYLDLRRFGSAPHAGFGLGFERLILMLTGISNIRDVIAFPRTPGTLDF